MSSSPEHFQFINLTWWPLWGRIPRENGVLWSEQIVNVLTIPGNFVHFRGPFTGQHRPVGLL